ncbi:MAG: hypothetical protein IK123_06835, partial [Lachnospiraceae bacterium]|nr:hypothetical protein [Lachnospiraceae bacterium]
YKYITKNNRNITKESDTPPENASGGSDGIVYSVKAVLSNGVTGETTFEIEKRKIADLTVSYMEPVYNGTEQAVVFTVKYKNMILKEGVDYELQANAKATDVGENMVMLRCTGNYTGSKPYSWSLKKATPSQSMFRVQHGVKKVYKDLPYKYSLKYNGKSFSAKEAQLKPDYTGCGEIHYHYRDITGWSESQLEEAYDDPKEYTDELPSKPGTYAVIMSFEEGQNFKAIKLEDKEYVIYGTVECSKGDNRISVINLTAGTGGRQCDLSLGVPNADGEVTYAIDGETLGCTVKGNILTTGNTTGTIVISAKAAGNEYYIPRTATFNVEIKDMKFATMTISQQSTTYGTELPDAIPSPIAWTKKPTAQYTGVLMDGTPYSSTEKPTKVGEYTVTLTGETDDTVYTGSADFFVFQKEVTFSGVKVIDKIYDGNDKAELDTSAMVLDGVLSGDSVILHVGAIYADEKVGKNKDIYYIETWFDGPDGSNYIIGYTPDGVKAEIKPRPVTVTALDQEVVMGTAVSSGIEYAKLEGAVSDHTLSAVTITGNTSAITESGKVTPSAAKIVDEGSEDVTANYSITYAKGNLRVSGKSIEGAAVEVSGSYSYNGSAIVPKDADITVSFGEDVLKKGTDYKISVTDNLNAGTATVIAEGVGNYSGKATGLFVIEPCVLTDPDIDIAPASYTGAAVEPNVSVTDNKGNIVNPKEYSVIYGNNIKVSSEAKVTLVDKEGGNYIVSGSALFEIKKGATRNLEDINRNVGSKTQNISVPLSSVMPSDMGTISKYDIYEEEVTSGSVIVDDATIGIDGILKLEIHGGKAGDAIVQSVHIIGQNYDCLISVKIKLNELDDPVYTAPEAKALSYTGKEQELIKAGSVSKGGVMEYSLDESTWSTSIPVAIEAGSYTVYWHITETTEVNGVDSTPLSVYIKGVSYKLTVQDGSGSGNYEAGESVTIVANAPASGKVFDKWSCDDDILFVDATAMTTGFIMPSKNITVKALYKADEKPMPQLTKVPTPKANLRYNYNSQVLIERGEAVGGILYYALGENTKKAPEESKYKVSLPIGCEAGYYYVWYYIKGDSSHASTAPAYITVVINNADGSTPEAPHGEDIPDPVIDPSYLDSAFSIVPYIDSTTTELHLVKGQKFNMPEKGWKSDKSKIIKISKSGKLSAKKTTGTSDYVTLSHDGRLDIKVYVTQPHFEKKSLSMSAGESRSCGFVLEDTKLPVFYSSASPDVATVDQYGMIRAVGKGTAVITAYVNSKAYNCKIKVAESTPQTTRTMHLSVNDKKTVNIKGLKKVTWESSDNSVVSVSKKNKIKAEGKGSAKLTTVYDSVTYVINVTVEDPTIVSGFKGSKKKYSTDMKLSDVKQIEFNALGFEDPLRQVVFKSSKPA